VKRPVRIGETDQVANEQFFERVGGEDTFRSLVGRFYRGVALDPLLRTLYPEEDLGPAAERLTMFLIQYWGGPGTYSQTRGHPRLRMRHAPFTIGIAQRDAWLGHMRAALDSLDLEPADTATLWDYLSTAADSLRNSPG
jgi:hemoglobin